MEINPFNLGDSINKNPTKHDLIDVPELIFFEGEIELKENVILPVPHWCYPDDQYFCDK